MIFLFFESLENIQFYKTINFFQSIWSNA